MAYSNGQAPLPPPVGFRGGNRNSQHVVGGKTSNFAYAPGANLAAARQGYQSGAVGSHFRNMSSVRPQFGQTANAMQAGQAPTAAQAQGNMLRMTAGGAVRPVNAPPGLGYQNMPGGPVRQHTTPGGMAGEEALASNLTYTPLAPTPVTPPVQPPPSTTTTKTGTGGTAIHPDPGINEARRRLEEQRRREEEARNATRAAQQNAGGTTSTGTFTAPNPTPTISVVPQGTAAPTNIVLRPDGSRWTLQQAIDHWTAHNMGARTRTVNGKLVRTDSWADFLTKRGLA